MTIAQPFMAGSSVHQMSKSREGRQKNSFVPGGTLDDGGHRVPAMNGWAIFRGSGATPKTATGTGALPSNVSVGGRAQAPANGGLGWTNGAKSVALQNPKGISSFSPALTRSGYAGWWS